MKPQDPNDGESKQIGILSAGLTGIVCLVAITTVVVLGMRRRQNENSTKGKLSSNFVNCNQKKIIILEKWHIALVKLPFYTAEDITDDDCHYDMVEIDEVTVANEEDEGTNKPQKPLKEFEVNKDTNEATIVETLENPYYVGMNDIDLEDNDMHDRIVDADILEYTENPYYGKCDTLNFEF